MCEIKPYEYQQRLLIDPCVVALKRPLKVAINGGACGSGKTICGLATAKQMNLSPMIICPKAVKSSWARHCKKMDVTPVGIETIEKLRNGSTQYVKRIGKNFIWQLDPEKVLILADEAHKCKGPGINGGLLGATRQIVQHKKTGGTELQEFYTLMLTATLATDPMGLRYHVGSRLGLHNYRNANTWLQKNGCYVRTVQTRYGERHFYDFPTDKKIAQPYLDALNKQLFPRFGATLHQRDIPGFKEHNIIVESYDLDPKNLKELKNVYDELQVRKAAANGDALPEMLYDKMSAELLKAPLFIDLVQQHLDEGMSVIVMVNHRETHHAVAKAYPDAALIIGDQKQHERDKAIQDFLSDRKRVCISTISAGGVGLDLNDQNGDYPRVMLLSPTYHVVDFTQALGRHYRSNNKTPALTKLVLAAHTAEDKIRKKLSGKLNNLATLTDGDMLPI